MRKGLHLFRGILNVSPSAADSRLPTPAVDLLICYKNNAGAVAGVTATLGRVMSCSRAQTGCQQYPSLPGPAVQAGAECRRQQAGALSLHVSDKGLHQLDQRLLTLRADLGERGGLALRRGKDASSRRGWRGECSAREAPDEALWPPSQGGPRPLGAGTPGSPQQAGPSTPPTNSELSSCFIRCLSRGCTAGSRR